MIIAVAIIVIIVGVVVYGSTRISSNMFVKAQCALNDKNKVLLTFDDGPDERQTALVLDMLKYLNIKALFFVIGKKAAQHPELLKRILAEGHTIGNHTYKHNPKYLFYTKNRIFDELQKTDNILKENGISTKYFRPPLGVTNDALAWAVRKMGYQTIGWNVRSFDTRREPRERVLARICKRLTGGNIVLLHDRVEHVEWLVEKISEEVQRRNLSFATPNDLCNMQ